MIRPNRVDYGFVRKEEMTQDSMIGVLLGIAILSLVTCPNVFGTDLLVCSGFTAREIAFAEQTARSDLTRTSRQSRVGRGTATTDPALPAFRQLADSVDRPRRIAEDTPSTGLGRRPCRQYRLSRFATKAGEKSGLRQAATSGFFGRSPWESRGIGGGGAFYSASISPHDSLSIYIATDMSAVFQTPDFGRSWDTVDFRVVQGGINSHVRFTSDPLILYVVNRANDSGTPMKSHDGGTSWSVLSGDPTWAEAFYLFADPHYTERLLLSDWMNLYFSDDGGSSFTLVYTAASSDYGLHVAGVFWDGEDIYVGTNDGVLVSSDAGENFYFCFTFSYGEGIPDDEAIASFAGAKENDVVRFFAVTLNRDAVWGGVTGEEMWSYRGIYRVDWGVGEWTKVTNGIPSNVRPFFVGMALDEIAIAYVAGGDASNGFPSVFKTTDGGDSWDNVFYTENNQNIVTGWCGDGGDTQWWYPEYALGFAVSPTQPNRAIITDLGFAHVTENGGITWRQVYVDSMYENPAGSETPNGLNYGGIGLENTSCWWLHWVGRDALLAGFSDIRGIRSEDGGETWTAGSSLGLPHNSTYYITEHPESGVLYAATSSVHDMYESTRLTDATIDGGTGRVIWSADAGASWQTLKDFGHGVMWLAMDPNDNESLYASVVQSTAGGIYVTFDLSAGASATWSQLSAPPRTQGHPFNIHVLNDGTLVATYSGRRESSGFTESSGVFVSTNGGVSWVDRSDQNMRRWTKDLLVDPHDSAQNTWYVSVFSHWGSAPNEVGGLYRTTDRGVSWSRISDLYRVESATVHPDSSQVLFLSTETQGLWRTDSLGSINPAFVQLPEYPFRNPTRIFFDPWTSNKIWITSFGNGLRVRDQSRGEHNE